MASMSGSGSPPSGPERSLKRSRDAERAEDFGISDQDEMNYLLYHQFLNVGRDIDDGKVTTTNGWQLEALGGKKWEDVRFLREFTGRIPLDNAQRMEKMRCYKQNAFCLTGQVAAVFYGMKEALTPYFTYTFRAERGTMKGPQNSDIYFVKPETVKWAPLPMNYHIAKHVVENELVGKRHDMLRDTLLRALQRVPDRNATLTMPDLDDLLRNEPTALIRLRNMGIMKRLFMHDELVGLYPFYHAADLDYLSIEAIRTLVRFVVGEDGRTQGSDPAALCFWSTLRDLGMRCEDFDRVWYLPELTHAQYAAVCTRRKFESSASSRMAVWLYDALMTEHRRRGHKFLDHDTMRVMAGGASESIFTGALFLMQEVYRCTHMETCPDSDMCVYYPRRMAVCEKMIVQGIEKTLLRYQYAPPARVSRANAKNYPFLPNHDACSEQIRMVIWCLYLAIVNISGPGGAGKSDSLSRYLALLDAEKWNAQTVFTTYQANNAAEAAKRNTSHAQTTHRLLAMHSAKCKKSPLYRGDANKKRKGGGQTHIEEFVERAGRRIENGGEPELAYETCPFENVRCLIIDEVGLYYDELFAVLLHVLTTCGKLSQIITCGDHRQQVQIQPGQLQKDLFAGFDEWTMRFSHCHRFDDEAAVIFRHNANMIDKMIPERIIFEPNVFEAIFLKRRSYRMKDELRGLEDELVEIFQRIGFNDSEKCMLVSRTHELKDLATRAVERVHFGGVSSYGGLQVGCKILCTKTNYDIDMISKRVLVLEAIEDCARPDGRTIKSLDDAEYPLLNMVDASAKDTQRDRKPYGLVRRLRARIAGHTDYVYIPYEPHHRTYVERASAITERSCQGTEADHVVVLKTSFWAEADVKECMYVVCTRQRKRLTIVMTDRNCFLKWAKNPSMPRNSLLASKLRELYKRYKDVYPVPADSPDITHKAKEENGKFEPEIDIAKYMAR